MKRCLLWLLYLLILFLPLEHTDAKERLVLTVTTSPNSSYYSEMTIEDRNNLAGKILKSAAVNAAEGPDLPRAKIGIGSRVFLLDSYHRLYEPTRGKRILISSWIQNQLDGYVNKLEKAHFGNPLDWDKVREQFGRMKYAEVIDMETGEKFRVQRRAGSRHADVQPLTKQDTAVFKRIYQGKWSWRRRAILVSINGERFAASMNGMPHGAGAIRGNNFPGHFCIHFQGSSTHKRTEPDPAHHLMITKASGDLKKLILEASLQKLVEIYLLSLQQNDLSTLEMTTDGFTPSFSLKEIDLTKYVILNLKDDRAELLASEVHVTASYIENGTKKKKAGWVFHLKRHSPLERWKICGLEQEKKTMESPQKGASIQR
ncbi:hypothetical protein ACQCN2_19395 [Brevibacillus ginsengisoli]|uniref:hypothetical protein n=1 Tax=Brevibacillus ginsengisoli TaxID=363854 RepID=UPI003CE6E24E